MKKIILLAIIFTSCEVKKENLCGTYKVHKSNYIEKCMNFLTGTHRIMGVELLLNKDSTFVINTCSYIASGKWSVKENILLLNYESKKTFVDSLNNFAEVKNSKEQNSMSEEFIIKKNSLTQYDKNESENFILKINK